MVSLAMQAYFGIHQPKSLNEADLARRRLVFDEFFYLQLGRLFQMLEGLDTHLEKDGLLDKYRKPELNAVFMEEWSALTKKFMKALPYSLTPSQLTAVSEIIWDLKQPVPMNRLLQGDVGCGKTVVAFLACMEVIAAGHQDGSAVGEGTCQKNRVNPEASVASVVQNLNCSRVSGGNMNCSRAAFMVPTELLAVQHYEHFLNMLENMGEVNCKPSVALLTGSTPSKQSRIIRSSGW
ncbi:unnamed protein product [Thlaspi arvense]|uniref:DEAD/DEAH-box helicase domain-containing protein n=1 Tax=Thlaspi arvense TaxID=13288 RepID=A0AAU9S2B6_THLAR|nr:unnamed protein product [Thlaspi arvense]